MKKFISIIVLILVIIGLVIGLGYSWKLIINKDKEILTLTQENTDLKETVTTLNNTIENLQNNINDEIEDEDNKKEEISFFFDESKVINKEENTKITQDIVDSMSVLSISVNIQDNSLTLNFQPAERHLHGERDQRHPCGGGHHPAVCRAGPRPGRGAGPCHLAEDGAGGPALCRRLLSDDPLQPGRPDGTAHRPAEGGGSGITAKRCRFRKKKPSLGLHSLPGLPERGSLSKNILTKRPKTAIFFV